MLRSFPALPSLLLALRAVGSVGQDVPPPVAAIAVPRELVVPLAEGGSVAISTRGPSAFRVRLLPDVDDAKDRPLPLSSPMVSPDEGDAPFAKILWTNLGEGKACRFNSSDESHDGFGTAENKTASSVEECKSLCEQAIGCKGVEWGEEGLRCEFWTRTISAVVPSKGHQCLNFTDKAEHPRAISVFGIGSLAVSAEGRLVLRGPRGELLTESEPVGNPQRPPHAFADSNHPGGWFQGTPGEIGGEQVWSGDAIFLRAHSGMYLEADGDQLRARSHSRGDIQKMILESKGGSGLVRHGDIVYLHIHSGTALDVHGGAVQARWDAHGQWQEFIIERKYGIGVVQAGDHIFLKANEGHYIDVEDETVSARWQEHGTWQTLTVEKAGSSHLLRSGDGLFLQTDDADGKLLEPYGDEVRAKEATHAAFQRWVVEKKGTDLGTRIFSGDKVFLWTLEGTTMDINTTAVKTRFGELGESQEISIVRAEGDGPVRQGDRIFLKAQSGLFVIATGEAVRASAKGQTMVVQTRVETCTQTFALNGTTNASSWKDDGFPWRAVDGDGQTGWIANESDHDWVSIDLGASFTLSRVEIRWGTHFAESYFLQGSVDGSRWDNVALALGREGWVVTVLAQGSRARWVRIMGNTRNSDAYEVRDIAVHVCQKTLAFSARGGKLYGKGASAYDAHRLIAVAAQPQVCNRATYVPYYWSTDGYAALVAVGNDGFHPHLRRIYPASYTTDGKSLSWGWLGTVEFFLMPAATLEAGTHAYFALTGAPRVPPRWAFGFIASRWGWKDQRYIEATLENFRDRHFPLDAIVMDFEWYTNRTDYGFAPHGETWYQDFGTQRTTFPNPKQQLKSYRQKFHVRMGGIRKPRLGNTDFLSTARFNGWLLAGGADEGQFPSDMDRVYAWGRNLNFSNTEVRDWYARQLLHLLNVGISFWWNDEGETDYFTYFYWNTAQVQALRATNSSPTATHRRFFSLNRAFTPGLARLGGAVWTGDIDPSWEDLRRTPGLMLNYALAGAPYVACDIGGYSGETQAELLTRWMQVGVFMPIMRVHSWLWARPHWPWKFGLTAATAMREALELRYRLIPYHYSLAHGMFDRKHLWMRPLAMEFPDDPVAVSITTQWMDGSLMVAPVLREDSHREVYLPAGKWYHFNSTSAVDGEVHLGGHAEEDEIPLFVRAGTVLPLAPVVQSTDELPGGPLEIQIYSGADGSFDLVEDDGESVNYEVGLMRTTNFVWYDSARTLSWRARGSVSEPGRHAFTQVRVTVFDSKTHHPIRLEARDLLDGGSIPPSELQQVLQV